MSTDTNQERRTTGCAVKVGLLVAGIVLVVIATFFEGSISAVFLLMGRAFTTVALLAVLFQAIGAFINAIRSGDA